LGTAISPFLIVVDVAAEKLELAAYWIAKDKASARLRNSQRIPEAIFVWVGEDELPGFAGVGGFVEAGEVSFAGRHDDGGVLVEGLDAAEVEVVGSGWCGAALPSVAVVGGAEDGALGSAGPCDSVAEGVDAAEAGGGVGVLELELGLCGGGEEEDCEGLACACVGRIAERFGCGRCAGGRARSCGTRAGVASPCGLRSAYGSAVRRFQRRAFRGAEAPRLITKPQTCHPDRSAQPGTEFADAAFGPTTKGSESAFQFLSASGASCGVGLRAVQFLPSSREMSVPLGPTVIQVLVVGS